MWAFEIKYNGDYPQCRNQLTNFLFCLQVFPLWVHQGWSFLAEWQYPLRGKWQYLFIAPGRSCQRAEDAYKKWEGGRGWKKDNEPEDVTDILKPSGRERELGWLWRKLFWQRKIYAEVVLYFRQFHPLMSSLALGSQK